MFIDDSAFTTTGLKVSGFILFPAIPEVLGDCAGLFLRYFPRAWNTSSHKHFPNGMLFSWILRNNLQEVTAVTLLTKQKMATTIFWNVFAHNKLTETGQINQNLPYWHYTPWKDLALVRLHGFSQFSTSTLLMELDLATNSWWERWQLCCLSKQQENCFHPMYNQILSWFPFLG